MKFGTIARYRVKPGNAKAFIEEMGKIEATPPAGWLYATTFQSTTDPDEIWISIVFESEEAYRKSANSPDMDKQYRETLEKLQGPPEWHDGNVIHEAMSAAASA